MHPGHILTQHKRALAILRKRSGQALIEAALTLSVLCMMLVGAFELGKVAYAWIEVTRAAKAGVQYGDTSAGAAFDTSGIQTAAANEAPDITGLNTVSSVACTCSNGGTVDCSNNSACPNAHIIQTLTVQTSVTYDPGIHLPGLPSTYTLHGEAVQQVLP